MLYQDYEKYRDDKKLNNAKVAKCVGITAASLSQWKNNKTRLKLETLFKIGKLLDIPKKEITKDIVL